MRFTTTTVGVSALACLASARPHLAVRQSGASAFASSSDGSLKLSSQDAPVSGAGNANGASTWSLSMDDSSNGAKQKITGFGSAVTDGTVANYNALSSDQQSQLIQDMSEFTLVRHTIGSSDMSPNGYSYDDNGGNVDTSLSSFNLGDSGNAMTSMLAAMRQAQSALTLFGSVWYPPQWMKNSDNTFNTQYSDTYAQYLIKYLNAYSSAGASIDALALFNEPLHNQETDFTTGVSADVEGQMIQNNVGPAFSSAGLNTEIWAYDHNTDVPSYPDTVLSDAGQYTNSVAWHCYQSPSPDWSVLSDFQSSHPGVSQYMTECYTYDGDDWTQTIDFTMGPLQNYAMGVVSWPMGTATDGSPYLSDGCSTCRGLFETSGSSYSLTTDYYMLSQFAKGIQKGATIQSVTGNYFYDDGTGVNSVTAINPDGSRVLVVQNNFPNSLYLTLNTTSGDQWSGMLYQQSLTTWTLPSS